MTVRGELLVHMLCHFVLPYSNWQSVTVCMSESLLALRRGVQAALFRLGHHPQWHQTDNSTAATHTIGASERKFSMRCMEPCSVCVAPDSSSRA